MPLAAALVAGVALALAFSHWTGWSAGGLITPGTLLMALAEGWPAVAILVTAVAVWGLALLARQWLPLHGRRRWGFCVAASATLGSLAAAVRAVPAPDPLGLVVPGLIASALVEQGPGPTLTGLVTVTAATWWILIAGGVA